MEIFIISYQLRGENEEKTAIIKVERVTERVVVEVVLPRASLLLHLPLHICSHPPTQTPQPSPAMHSHHPRLKFKATTQNHHLHFSRQRTRKRDGENKLTLLGVIYMQKR